MGAAVVWRSRIGDRCIGRARGVLRVVYRGSKRLDGEPLDMTTEGAPYSQDSRLFIVYAKSKSPTPNEIDFAKPGSTFTVSVREVVKGLPEPSRLDPEKAKELAPPCDLLPDDGYVFIPGGEFDDMCTFLLKAESQVYVSAELTRRNALRQPSDSVSVERIVMMTM